jgi:hypothetical protein
MKNLKLYSRWIWFQQQTTIFKKKLVIFCNKDLTVLIRPELRDKTALLQVRIWAARVANVAAFILLEGGDLSLNLPYLEDTDIQEQE